MRRVALTSVGTVASMLLAPMLCAQSIVGTVRDSAGRGLRDADVIVEPSGVRSRSDSAGRFSVRVPGGAASVLRVRLVGYRGFEEPIRVPSFGTVRRDVVLARLPQVLSTVTVLDRRGCAATTLDGFECRRSSGVGHFRDAGELRSMRPRYWADMLDGMPGLRRDMRLGPRGPEWRLAVPPSRCLREIFNGQPPMEAVEASFAPDEYWEPEDVVAIEYYAEHRDVPPQYARFAWYPQIMGQPCGLIVYWLRGADRSPQPRRASGGGARP